MKKISLFLGFLISLSIIVNLLFFFFSIKLSDDISLYEDKMEKIHHQNINLEKQLSQISSLEYAKKVAVNLDLNKKVEPIYLENLKYAFIFNK